MTDHRAGAASSPTWRRAGHRRLQLLELPFIVALALWLSMVGLALGVHVTPSAAAPGTAPVTPMVAAGDMHSVVLRADGSVWTFGSNRYGQLGRAVNSGTDTANPTAAEAMTGATSIATGADHTLVLKTDGSVWAFGRNQFGQLGVATNSGTTVANPTPVQVMTGAIAVAAGDRHSLVLKSDGTVWTFGFNFSGQLGSAPNIGTLADNPTPTQVMTGGAAIAGGDQSSFVVRNDATLWSFGNNDFGQLGSSVNNGTSTATAPAQVMTGVATVAGGSLHTLVRKTDATVWSMGMNWYGELGSTVNNQTGTPNPTPAQVFTGAKQVAAGEMHSAVLRTDGTLWTFGYNGYGELGVFDSISASPVHASPIQVMTGASAVAAGQFHMVVLKSDGSVWTFGNDRFGVLGRTTPSGVGSSNPNPTQVMSGINTPGGSIGLSPARLLDTRPGAPTVDGLFTGLGSGAAPSVIALTVAGRGGVPADTTSAVVNVTVNSPEGDGFLTVYPCGQPVPNTSSVNYKKGQTVANLVLARIGTNGQICIFGFTPTHVVVDVNAYYPPRPSLVTLDAPARLLDSRPGRPTVDGLFAGIGTTSAGTTLALTVTGRGGVPADASAVILNVTATEPGADGFVTVYACGQGVPNASNVNYVTGQTTANLVVAKIGASGQVCLSTYATTHLIADVAGYFDAPASTFPAASSLTLLASPSRVLDSRPGHATVDGTFAGGGLSTADVPLRLQVGGRAGIPSAPGIVVLNVTATEAKGGGFVTVYPCGQNAPNASNVNYVDGATVPNLTFTKTDGAGLVCITTMTPTHLVADVIAYQGT